MDATGMQSRIGQLRLELASLETSHERLVKDFQQRVQQNQSRYQQLVGAIAELTQLIQHDNNPNSGSTQPDALFSGFPGPGNRFGEGHPLGGPKLQRNP
jgi:hypothetical protein